MNSPGCARSSPPPKSAACSGDEMDRYPLRDRIVQKVSVIAEREGLDGDVVLDKLATFGEWLGRKPEAAILEVARIYYVDLKKLATRQKRLPSPPKLEQANG